MKRSGFKTPTKEKLAELNEKKRQKQLSKLKEKKPRKSAPVASQRVKKTARAKKMEKKKALLEKYDLPSIPHSRWGTGKNPTDTDILRGMLWTVFSKYIRERDKDKPCISCGIKYTLLQAGHFVPVGGSSVDLWFDEKNVHGECEKCNAFDSFHVVPMRKNLIEMYGEDVVESIESRRHLNVKLDDSFYIDKIKYYKSL